MNEIQMSDNNIIMDKYIKSDNILNDIQSIIDVSQGEAYYAVNTILSQRNWLISYRIAEEQFEGENRAEYGAGIIKELSKELTAKYGKGFTKTNLYSFYMFYKFFPKIFHSVSGKSTKILSWTHYRTLLQVKDEAARNWYEKEAYEQTWSVRTLQRNINPQYYYSHIMKKQLNLIMFEAFLFYYLDYYSALRYNDV